VQANWKGLGSYGTLGLEIVLGIVLTSYVGIRIDRHYHSGQVFLGLGFLLGLAHAVRVLVRTVRQANREAEREEAEQRIARQKYHEKRHDPRG
jgi:ATP synthase protein I